MSILEQHSVCSADAPELGDEIQDDILHYFVTKGANLDDQDNSGWTPLFYAVHLNNSPGLRQLLQDGADINVSIHDGDKGGTVIFHLLLWCAQIKVCKTIQIEQFEGLTCTLVNVQSLCCQWFTPGDMRKIRFNGVQLSETTSKKERFLNKCFKMNIRISEDTQDGNILLYLFRL